MLPDIPTVALIFTVSLLSALTVYFAFCVRLTGVNQTARDLVLAAEKSTVFLFDDEDLIDATEPALSLLNTGPDTKSGWPRLTATLANRFPILADDLSSLGVEGRIKIRSTADGDNSEVHAEWWDELVRIEIVDPQSPSPEIPVDRQILAATHDELTMLRHIVAHSPVLAWQTDERGNVSWANNAYLKRADLLRSENAQKQWPPINIFPSMSSLPEGEEKRYSVTTPAGNEQWYKCFSAEHDQSLVHFAQEADAEIQAEVTLKEFVQTLTKTFAHLPIGLAVFDHNRQLAMFNPALTDLTSLPIVFLSSRPMLSTFLDRLRDQRMVPEPKNYKSWRHQMEALEAEAVNGTYEETWSLPSGRTYRVSGRPHPNGAIAFQFEDITPEISLTRHFRSELELSQSVLDAMPDAIAVFASCGPLTLSNKSFVDLWGVDPSVTLGEFNSRDAIKLWSEQCAPSNVWKDVEEFLGKLRDRKVLTLQTALSDGKKVEISLRPLSGGASYVGFRKIPVAKRSKNNNSKAPSLTTT